MIIVVSIVDKHRPAEDIPGDHFHVGTYTFEIPYSGDSHFDFHVVACPVENEPLLRESVGKLLTKETMDDPIRADGSPV